MAILRPVSAYPNKNTVDATVQNTFSTIIQGASTVVSAYQVFVYDMDTYIEIYDSGKIQLSKTLTAGQTLEMKIPVISEMINGYSYFWQIRLFQYESTIFITDSVVQSGSTDTSIVLRQHNNIKPEMYLKIGTNKRSILSYDKTTGIAILTNNLPSVPSANTKCEIYSDFVDSINFPFYTKSVATLSVVGIGNVGDSRYGKFYAKFEQEQNIGIRWHQFKLMDNNYEIIKDTGKIFNSEMSFIYENFMSGNYYFIQCIIEDTSGIVLSSNMIRIDVTYQKFAFNTGIEISQNCDKSSVVVKWEADRFSTGKATGEYEFIYNSDISELGQTIDGVPSIGVNYFYYDKLYNGDDALWNDDYFWTETRDSDAQKRLNVLSGIVYYDKVSSKNLFIDSNEFTLLTDIKIPNTKQGVCFSLTGIGSDYQIKVVGYNLYYILNNVSNFICSLVEATQSGQTIDGVPIENTGYKWDDTDLWNDDYFWTEGLPFLSHYKITVFPDKVTATKI